MRIVSAFGKFGYIRMGAPNSLKKEVTIPFYAGLGYTIIKLLKEHSTNNDYYPLLDNGVNGADMGVLKSLSERTIKATEKDTFSGIFNWISESMAIISASRVEDNPQLPGLPVGFADARKVPDTW